MVQAMPQRKEDEWTTRRQRVDKALREAGWTNIVDFEGREKESNQGLNWDLMLRHM